MTLVWTWTGIHEIATVYAFLPFQKDLEKVLESLFPVDNKICLDHKTEFEICMGFDEEFVDKFEKTVVKCVMMHVDVFGDAEDYLGIPCKLKELLGVSYSK